MTEKNDSLLFLHLLAPSVLKKIDASHSNTNSYSFITISTNARLKQDSSSISLKMLNSKERFLATFYALTELPYHKGRYDIKTLPSEK